MEDTLAEIVLGFAASHGPTMTTPPEKWAELGAKDVQDPRFDFATLKPKAGIEQEITIERQRERYAAIQEGIKKLADVLHEANPDVVVVFSNPHGGVRADLMQPTFGVHLNDAPPSTEGPPMPGRNRGEGGAPPAGRAAPEAPANPRDTTQYPTDGDLARHLMSGLIEEGIDVAANFQSKPGLGLDGAYNLLFQQFDKEAKYPYVPVLISRYLPNQATPKRTYEMGQAVRRVIERWDSPKRVAIMGSGGLSHQVVDEDLDQSVIDALTEGDTQALFNIDRVQLNRAPGTPEILNWVATAGVMEPKTMTLIDYIPAYRSLAGTGHGNTFGYWK
jgi:3-O-methylgallate 3,4-dioxygenase